MKQNYANIPSDWKELLALNGHFAVSGVLDGTAREYIANEDWEALDAYIQVLTAKGGELFKLLSRFCDFEAIEFIISIRDARNEWEEDGIWHDDGSRKMAFSLSLIDNPQEIKGGVLEIRKKNTNDSLKIPPFSYAEMIVFATGVSRFEHKINQVTSGRRIIIAGWCQ
tara:strand:- start:44 stop:547 length:504 start_codon:yes stop_codon:yes gene_type:complete